MKTNGLRSIWILFLSLAVLISIHFLSSQVYATDDIDYSDDYDYSLDSDYTDDYDYTNDYDYGLDDDYDYDYDETCDHVWGEWECVKKATYKKKGKKTCSCESCGETKSKTFSWKLSSPDSEYYTSYNVIDNSVVYRNSKSITVKLDNALKGSVVIVKIGKKTYKKKVGSKKKIKIKIKKPKKYAKTISINVYKGKKRIGRFYYLDSDDEWSTCTDTVYYAKNIRKGMTKKQVSYTYNWGDPDSKSSSSDGWSYWNYEDGSSIGFKKGRVKYWYNAVG